MIPDWQARSITAFSAVDDEASIRIALAAWSIMLLIDWDCASGVFSTLTTLKSKRLANGSFLATACAVFTICTRQSLPMKLLLRNTFTLAADCVGAIVAAGVAGPGSLPWASSFVMVK